MADTPKLPESWDSYIGFVDDAPASVMLNLALEPIAPLEDLPVLHFWSVDMIDAGPHGMGTAEEAEAFAPIEDAVTEAAEKLGLVQVGRLRNHGYFQLTYYGAEDIIEKLGALAHEALDDERRATLKFGTDDDPEWNYYLSFLCPAPQQRQWMNDRNVVQQFMQHGDPLTPRPVDHFADFPSENTARAFANIIAEQGFDVDVREPTDENPNWVVQGIREDEVTLGHIHGVVMTLTTMAEEAGGAYNGWGAALLPPG